MIHKATYSAESTSRIGCSIIDKIDRKILAEEHTDKNIDANQILHEL